MTDSGVVSITEITFDATEVAFWLLLSMKPNLEESHP